uniref:Uncharacterized protein n=1 Tax=Lepeophtheirus salmonis TaxID=72036 RepID=A0A0K2T658_LEPSM
MFRTNSRKLFESKVISLEIPYPLSAPLWILGRKTMI